MQRGIVLFALFFVLSCLSVSLTSAQTCGYGGIDVSTSSDLILNTNGYQYSIRPCGSTTTPGSCGAQFCQNTTIVSYWNSTGNYASTGTDNTPQWAYTTYNGANGIAQVIQDGTDCGGYGARQGTIMWICSQTATTPQFASVNEAAVCHYQAVIYTNAVCGITTAATQAVGSAVISTQCGGGIYNLASLSTSDLSITQQGTGWTNIHYIRLCGVVSSTNLCLANTSLAASVCQVDPSGSGTGNTLSVYQPLSYPVVYVYNGNGVSQIIQDGQRCGSAEEERLTNITLVCNSAATTPQVVSFSESPLCHYNYMVQTSAVCGAAFVAAPVTVATCGYGPYDLTSLTNQDFLLNQTNNRWAIRLCGQVQTPGYCGGQFCQGATNVSVWSSTGNYAATGTDNAPQWAYTTYQGQTGVAQILQDGSDCGGYGARQGTIEFICNTTATTPYFANVIETGTCHYQAIIFTSLVCGATSAQLQSTGSALISTQCGGGIYDLSSITSSDITYTTGGDNYFIRLCGTVSGTQRCQQNASLAAQVCQVDPTGSGTGYAMSVYQPYQYPTIWQYNGNGLSQIVQDGERCGGAEEERLTNITLICSSSATTPVVTSITESPTCHYTIIIQTNAVCGAAFSPLIAPPTTATGCQFGPYNLNSISGKDIITYTNGYWWAIRPCGVVQTTGFCAGQFCQGLTTASFWNGTALANYASTGTDNVPMWASVTFTSPQGVAQAGVAQIAQDGTSCGGNVGARQGSIYFLCNPAATTPYISYINETIICHYVAVVQTSVVCGVRDASLEVPGSAFISNQCGATIYNLNALASSDIVGTFGPASNPTQYNYYVNLCGTVRNTNLCMANNSVAASVCQVDTTSPGGYGYPLSTWNPLAYPVVWQYNGNGVSQIVQDGFACGGEERLTNITLVCSSSATTPQMTSVVESPTCHYTITVLTNAVCGPAFAVAQPAGSCAWGGYDLSSLTGTDLYLSQSGYTWAIRPCGTVSNASLCGGQFCQGATVVSYYNPTGDYTSTNSDNTPMWAYTSFLGQNGIAQILQDGTDCGSYGARQGTIEFICNQTATTPYFANVIETVTCHYQAIVYTNLVCGISTSQLQQVGSAVVSTQCGGGMYDLTALSSADIVLPSTSGNANGYNWYVRLCGQVTGTNLCVANASTQAQVCQVNPGGSGTGYALSTWNPYAYPTVWQYNGNGISQFVQDGQRCNSAVEEERYTNITLVCSASATTPVVLSITESPVCHYNVLIQTSAVCGTPFSVVTTPVVQSCSFGGLDLSSIASQDLLWYGNGYWWAIRPCGTVQTTGFCAGQFCQGLTTVSLWNGTAVANYASTGTDNTPLWAYTTYNGANGIAQIIQDGTSCGGNVGSRQGTILFVCSASATTPYIASVTETIICHYQAIVYTSAVCGITTSQMQQVGASVVSTQCGGGIYNLQQLSSVDIIGQAGPASNPTQYNYYINICGTVRGTNLCLLNNSVNASVCQVDTTSPGGYGYPLSTYNPGQYPTLYTYNGNGVTQIIQDGFACGGEERLTNITLVCNVAATYPVLQSVTENPTCHYTMIVQTNQVCQTAFSGATPPPLTIPSSSSGVVRSTSSSSGASRSGSSSSTAGGGSTTGGNGNTSNASSGGSGLSGGAIAGIVIGSVVGAAILLAICFVVFAGSRGRKSAEPKEARATGQYGEMDRSHVEASQSGYEHDGGETGESGAEVEMQ